MITRQVTIGHRLGLHARASARLVQLSGQFQSEITLLKPGQDGPSADARSILSILLLAAGHGARLEVRAEGEDEAAAIEAVCRYLEG